MLRNDLCSVCGVEERALSVCRQQRRINDNGRFGPCLANSGIRMRKPKRNEEEKGNAEKKAVVVVGGTSTLLYSYGT
jgi:hypothetical protein